MPEKNKVVVAMSGGVDSSLTAALLQQKGYEVIGVTMQIWPAEREEDEHSAGGCCSLSAVDDARRVADKLGIPYYVMNFRDYFEHKVINNFVDEYLAGRTPNPCIACNKYVKFEALLQKAMALGAEYIATGHYTRLGYDEGRQRYVMRKSVDLSKDQTYALYNMTQHHIRHTLMPLGDFHKTETRRLAAELGLTVADKPDSQEICFVTDNNYRGFLQEKAGEKIKPGPFLDTKGNVLGQHEGIPFYTVGQRKGLGITFGEPMYVVAIDAARNAVILGRHEEVFSSELISVENNLIMLEKLTGPMEIEAKIRYSAKPARAVISPLPEDKIHVKFNEAQRAITPGQAVVFYDGDYVVGGGTIEKRL
ncbi:MAG: tRNA 2-thiouridine(34) synthase MnmA [Bacillota bacterium]